MSIRSSSLLLLCACALPAQVTLRQYAASHELKLQTVSTPADTTLKLADGDENNNFAVGDKVLTLSGLGLTDLDGIGKLQVSDHGAKVALAGVKSLQLFLNDNKLERLPAEFFDLQNVSYLYLMKNRLTAIPPEIARMHGLQGMYFTSNHISKLPPELFTMAWLRKLQVSKNQLTEIPDGIGNLVNMIHLNLSRNQIQVVPDSISWLRKLRICDLSDNRISRLPEKFGKVHILYQLRVRNNPLTALPAGFADMPGTIDITGTKIDLAQLSPGLRARISTEKAPAKPKL